MKILTVSTYPFSTPRHGGQHRMHNLVEAYRSGGHEVSSIGVLGSSIYPQEKGFLPMPPAEKLTSYLKNSFLMEDWAIGQLAASDDDYFAALTAMIDDVPDLIHVEHPWLFAFAKRYRNLHSSRRISILYGSANIEHSLKRTIVRGYLGDEHALDCERLVLDCETSAASQADLTCAVSASDAEWLSALVREDVVLAPNGVRDRPLSINGIQMANRIAGHHKYALYCASGHPPNVVGFFAMFAAGVGCLAPDERLVVAGSAGNGIRSDARFQDIPGLAKHFIDAGEVTEECLQGLISSSHAIILPITQGGGTNLKTAEALWAGKHIVATTTAMRGFEDFESSDGVTVCLDGPMFRQSLRASMARSPLALSKDEWRTRESVLWSSTLRPLVERVSALGPQS